MKTTKHNDEIGGRLCDAMLMLELALDTKEGNAMDYVAAAHSFVQAARSFYTEGEASEISEHAQEMLAAERASVVIADAKAPY